MHSTCNIIYIFRLKSYIDVCPQPQTQAADRYIDEELHEISSQKAQKVKGNKKFDIIRDTSALFSEIDNETLTVDQQLTQIPAIENLDEIIIDGKLKIKSQSKRTILLPPINAFSSNLKIYYSYFY